MALDLDKAIAGLRRFVLPTEAAIEQLCAEAKEALCKEPNVVHVAPPVSVVLGLDGGDAFGVVGHVDDGDPRQVLSMRLTWLSPSRMRHVGFT